MRKLHQGVGDPGALKRHVREARRAGHLDLGVGRAAGLDGVLVDDVRPQMTAGVLVGVVEEAQGVALVEGVPAGLDGPLLIARIPAEAVSLRELAVLVGDGQDENAAVRVPLEARTPGEACRRRVLALRAWRRRCAAEALHAAAALDGAGAGADAAVAGAAGRVARGGEAAHAAPRRMPYRLR